MNIFITSLLLSLTSTAACNKTTSRVLTKTDNKELSITADSKDGYFGPYSIIDESYGTQTTVTIDDNNRIMKTNALPNHDTGTFPRKGNPNTIKAQSVTHKIPLHPVWTGEARWVREPGIALNGVKFEPQTAEVIRCESGENYRVEGIQDLINLGLDDNLAHVQPNGAYHYHGVAPALIKEFDTGQDLVHIGFAHDGFPIYHSKSGVFASSFRLIDQVREGTDCTYSNPFSEKEIDLPSVEPGTFDTDWEYVNGLGDLDECNGLELNGQYTYIVTNEFPYVGRCLKGEFKEQRRPGPPPGGRPPRGRRGNRG